MEGLLDQLVSNPLNWVLFAFNLWLFREILTPIPKPPQPSHPEPIVIRNFTLKELRVFNGNDPKTPILIGVQGRVYDVSRGAQFYGPGGAYGNFAGRDASRALAKHSFEETMFSDEPDPLTDLTPAEGETLREWQGHFEGKYDHVGFLVHDNDK